MTEQQPPTVLAKPICRREDAAIYAYVHGNPVRYSDPTGNFGDAGYFANWPTEGGGNTGGGSGSTGTAPVANTTALPESAPAAAASSGNNLGVTDFGNGHTDWPGGFTVPGGNMSYAKDALNMTPNLTEPAKSGVETRIEVDPSTGEKFLVKELPMQKIYQNKFPTKGGQRYGCMCATELMVGSALNGGRAMDQNEMYNKVANQGLIRKSDAYVNDPAALNSFLGAKVKQRVRHDVSQSKMNKIMLDEIDKGKPVHIRVGPGGTKGHHSEVVYGYRKSLKTGVVDFKVADPAGGRNHKLDNQGRLYTRDQKGREVVYERFKLSWIYTYK